MTGATAQLRDDEEAPRRSQRRLLPLPRSLRRPHSVVLAGGGLIGLHLCLRAWLTYGAWFHWDDFNFMSRMANRGLTFSSLTDQYAGHLMPAGMLLSWLNDTVAPYDWRWPATELLLMTLAADVGLLVLLLKLFGPRIGILPPLALYLFSVITVPVAIWWAAGVNQLPAQIVLFWGLVAHVTYLRSRRLRWAVLANGWILFGLLWYEKTLLVYGAIGLLTLAYFAHGDVSQRIRQVWQEYRAAIVLYCVTGAVYLAIYIPYGLTFAPSRAIDHPVSDVAMNLGLRSYLTGIVGGPLRWAYVDDPSAVADPSELTVLVAAVAVLLLLREIRRCRARSMRAFLLVAFFLASDILLVLAGRASFVGATISLDYRYQGELSAVTAVALACSVMPILGAPEVVETIRRSEFLDRPRRVAIASAVASALGVWSSLQFAAHWQGATRPETYFHNLRTTLQGSEAPVTLLDATVPGFVMWGAGYPDNTLSHLLTSFESVEFATSATDTISVVDDQGRIQPMVVPPTRSAVPGPVPDCGYRLDTAPLVIPLDGPLTFSGWWVRMGYTATAPGIVTVVAGEERHSLALQPGLHAVYFTASGDFSALEVTRFSGRGRVCTDEVTVGVPEPLAEGASS